MKLHLINIQKLESVCSGGRYDNLAEYYAEKNYRVLAFPIRTYSFIFILNDNNYLNSKDSSPADVLIVPMTEDLSYTINISTKGKGRRNKNANIF